MTHPSATISRASRCGQGGNFLGQSHVAMSEVTVCGIPKLSLREVASTA